MGRARRGWGGGAARGAAWLAAVTLAGCPNPYHSNGIRPGPRGTPAVLLLADGAGGAAPLACYDDLWVRLRGPRDCADLVPPGARLRPAEPLGPGAPASLRVLDRGPGACAVRLAVAPAGPAGAETAVAAAAGLWLYDPADRVRPAGRGLDLRLDLDDDGRAERLVAMAGGWWLESHPGGPYDEVIRLGGCAAPGGPEVAGAGVGAVIP